MLALRILSNKLIKTQKLNVLVVIISHQPYEVPDRNGKGLDKVKDSIEPSFALY